MNTWAANHKFGQFVFPKDKMPIQVYPDWDQPISKQAIATQKELLE